MHNRKPLPTISNHIVLWISELCLICSWQTDLGQAWQVRESTFTKGASGLLCTLSSHLMLQRRLELQQHAQIQWHAMQRMEAMVPVGRAST